MNFLLAVQSEVEFSGLHTSFCLALLGFSKQYPKAIQLSSTLNRQFSKILIPMSSESFSPDPASQVKPALLHPCCHSGSQAPFEGGGRFPGSPADANTGLVPRSCGIKTQH